MITPHISMLLTVHRHLPFRYFNFNVHELRGFYLFCKRRLLKLRGINCLVQGHTALSVAEVCSCLNLVQVPLGDRPPVLMTWIASTPVKEQGFVEREVSFLNLFVFLPMNETHVMEMSLLVFPYKGMKDRCSI